MRTQLAGVLALLLATSAEGAAKQAGADLADDSLMLAPLTPTKPSAKEINDDLPLPKVAQKRIAQVEPASDGKVKPAVLMAAVKAAEVELRAKGYEVIPPAQVAAAHAKKKLEVPSCSDAPACLAKVGRVAGAGYVANVSVNPVGKQFAVKLTLVDTEDAKIVANIVNLVAQPEESVLADAVKKNAPRAATLLTKYIAERPEPAPLLLAAKPAEPKAPTPAAAAAATAAASKTGAPPAAKPGAVAAAKSEWASAGAPAAKPAEPAQPVVASIQKADSYWDQPATKPQVREVNAIDDSMRGEDVEASGVVYKKKRSMVLPYALMGGGVVAVGLGLGVFGLQAQSAVNDFKAGNSPLEARDRAQSKALLADVTTGAGIALAGGGVALWLLGGSDKSRDSLTIAPAGTGMAVAGRW